MTVSLSFNLWWLIGYLLVGIVLYWPLNWLAARKITNRVSLGHALARNGVIHLATAFVVQVVAWPLAIWELVR